MISIIKFRSICAVLLTLSTVLSARTDFKVENVKKLAVANNHLAMSLHRCLSAKSHDNIFLSPFSLSVTFGMLYYGTEGATAEELETVLGYEKAGLRYDHVPVAFNQFLTRYVSLENFKRWEYELDVANLLMVDKRFQMLPSYKRDIQFYFQAPALDVDFVNYSDVLVDEVNHWVGTRTNEKITRLLHHLSPDTAMVLLNAVYFSGIWKNAFDPKKTTPETFYNDGLESEAKKVPMMNNKATYNYGEEDNFTILELPYKGEKISMFVYLPKDRDGLKTLEQELTLEKISSAHQKLSASKVYVSLPKFKIEYTKELSPEFKELGAKKVFHPSSDFSGMTILKGAYVDHVHHKAMIEVNEEGSEAGAATGFEIEGRGGDYENFNADHPFVFSIVDKRTQLTLFVGRVNKL